jgi:hypothetical protein
MRRAISKRVAAALIRGLQTVKIKDGLRSKA